MVAFLLVFIALGRMYREMFRQPEARALLVVAIIVLLVGMGFYVQVEKWSWVDAFYFCIVTLGTVGYGDITPETDLGKIFTSFYIIVGLAVIGGFFASATKLFVPTDFLSKEKARFKGGIKKAEEKIESKELPADTGEQGVDRTG